MSHTYTFSTPEKPVAKKKPATGGGQTKTKVRQINKDNEVSTLGDLDALSALKSQMEDNTKKANEEG